MTPSSGMAGKANMAKGLVKDMLGKGGGAGRTGGPGHTTAPGGAGKGSGTSGADMRRLALKAREAFRK